MSDATPVALGDLRQRLDTIDAEIVRLLAQRLETVAEIGAVKQRDTSSVRDPERERDVLRQAEQAAVRLGISPSFVRDVFKEIIEHSVAVQTESLDSEAAER